MTILATIIFTSVVWYYLYEAANRQEDAWKQADRAMEVVLPAMTSVLGTALGFYFGSQQR